MRPLQIRNSRGYGQARSTTGNYIYRRDLAWDKLEIEQQVRDGIAVFSKYLSPKNMTFYMLVGYDAGWEEDWYRFEVLRSLGVHPFVMLFKGEKPIDQKLKHFARWVNKRIYKVCRWEEYRNWLNYHRINEEQQSIFY